ncbi:hypothetical protein FKM82_017136 [Ascaphus truei]
MLNSWSLRQRRGEIHLYIFFSNLAAQQKCYKWRSSVTNDLQYLLYFPSLVAKVVSGVKVLAFTMFNCISRVTALQWLFSGVLGLQRWKCAGRPRTHLSMWVMHRAAVTSLSQSVFSTALILFHWKSPSSALVKVPLTPSVQERYGKSVPLC